MKLRDHVIPCFILCGLIWWFITDGGGNTSVPPLSTGGATAAKRTPPGSRVPARPETAACEKQTRERVAELTLQEAELQKRGRATAKTAEFRRNLEVSRQGLWSELVATNLDTFQVLRQKAAATPAGQIRCTICDGKWYMGFCILCKSSGKCPTCSGTGTAGHDDCCPTCLGKGKCFRCAGSGKMPCPFCDDGMISSHAKSPRSRLAVN